MNRCERVTVVLTQDCEVSKMGCFAASSQWQAAFEKSCCTLVWVRCEVEVLLRSEKAFLYRRFCMNRKSRLFRKRKNVSFTENLPKRSQKRHSSANQTLFIYTSLSLLPIQKKPFPPSISHLHPAITYCSPKNTAILSQSALNPHAVTLEPRTDSKPFRHRFVRKTGFGSCRRKLL